jgi:type IV pilus assembly protein PilY1
LQSVINHIGVPRSIRFPSRQTIMCKPYAKLLLLLAGVLIACTAAADTYTDNFTGATASLKWTALNDACLTAGDGTGSIPKCPPGFLLSGMSSTPGKGALLLTPAQNNQTGAILSAFPPFPMSQGIQITFTTYTFGGDSGGTAHNGADGIVFFLTDGTQAPPTKTGAEGGSMGYDCSNDNGVYDGVAYGYLGLGIDEYGNFLNTGDNGSVGIYNSRNTANGTTAHGDNSYQNNVNGGISAGSGPQYQPERIGLRGAGNTNWAWLQSQNQSYYSGASNASKVKTACKTGKYVASGSTAGKNLMPITYNYNAIPGGYAVLPDNQPIANNSKSATHNPTASTPTSEIAWPITYKLTISPTGLLNFEYSYNNGAFQPVLANTDITASNGTVPSLLRFGFSAGTGGSNNVHEITCFQASPLASNSSASSNTVQGGKVITGTQLYLASYSSSNWWGSLVAESVMTDPVTGSIYINTAANWDAKCVLTGAAACDTMTSTDPVTGAVTTYPITAQSPTARTLLTSTAVGAGTGVALNVLTDLGSAQQTALNTNPAGVVDNQGQQRIDWLRGDRSVEQLASPPGNLRARTYVLGDIIDSSPTFVGAPASGGYPDVFNDAFNPGANASAPENQTGAQAYSAFVSTNAARKNVVYVGGNDGFVHGFRAGAFSGAGGAYDGTTNDGKELIGYMPYNVLLNKAVNLADPLYKHDYLVDATPAAGTVFYNKAWHTWLVGGVGSSGQEIYALNITDPSSFSASDVIGDWDSSVLTHLGNTVGTPIIARLHNGDWAIIFGSGLISASTPTPPTEGVYIGLIDPSNGSVTFKFLDTGAAPTGVNGAAGGVAYVTAADLDGDHIADYLYAGDTQGNVWRFDVTSSNTTQWQVSKFGNASATPLFVAKDASGNRQPITTAMKIGAVLTGTVTRVMVYFGTGQLTPITTAASTQYAAGTQTFYGVWDWDLSTWNGTSSVKYVSLTGTQSITRSTLLAQSVVTQTAASGNNPGVRTLSTTKVICWKDDASCAAGQYGWQFDLPDQGPTTGDNAGENEQTIYNPALIGGAVVVNTATPPQVNASTCNPGQQSGWTMAFNPATGGGLPEDFFPNSSGGFGGGSSTVGGIALEGVGTPTSLQNGGNSYLITQTVTGGAKLSNFNPQSGLTPARVSWRELVNP